MACPISRQSSRSQPNSSLQPPPTCHKMRYAHRGWVCAWLLPADGILAPIEDDFELQCSELANTLRPTDLDILASLVPGPCVATFAHSSRTWATGLPSGSSELTRGVPLASTLAAEDHYTLAVGMGASRQ